MNCNCEPTSGTCPMHGAWFRNWLTKREAVDWNVLRSENESLKRKIGIAEEALAGGSETGGVFWRENALAKIRATDEKEKEEC